MSGEANGNEFSNGSKVVPTLAAATEKLIHFTYLKEFRVEPCPLFKQHQCQQHRPYTCFHWHFANQRRRRPVRRKDGTFNYSPDIYCTKYDENSGICADGDECPFLHRVAGDVERKYHLRYYKTALCVHSTDARGQCAKNGPHCAFAHNAADLRAPIFDIREIQQQHNDSVVNGLLEHKDRTSFVVEDPAWQDQEHVLACYKTEPCKKPPRLCRQGYACPYYHNGKDRRRPPGVFKYRSTPCPSAKVGDEWADPDSCDNGDHCQYCHTRTEQQFHPEIYKSTKCNDMLQHGYCPRGPFCAFAHNDVELHCERQIRKPPALVTSVSGSPPQGGFLSQQQQKQQEDADVRSHDMSTAPFPVVSLPEAPVGPAGMSTVSPSHLPSGTNATPSYSSVLSKQRMQATAAAAAVKTFSRAPGPATTDVLSNSYPKAPGFERGQFSPTRTWTPDFQSAAANRMRTSSLTVGQLDLGCTLGSTEAVGTPPTPGSLRSNSFSPFARAHDSHIHASNALDELNFDDLALATIAEQREDQPLADAQSMLTGTSLYSSQSAPVQIPGTTYSSAFGTSSSPLVGASSSAGGDGPFRMSGSFGKFSADSVGSGSIIQQLPCGIEGVEGILLVTELQKAREELQGHRHKLSAWEDGLKQARQACEAWKRDAENNRRLALQAEAERIKATQERDQALLQLERLRIDMRRLQQLALGQLNNNLASQQQVNVEQLYAALQQEQVSPSQSSNGPVCGRCGRHVNGSTASIGCPVCSVKPSQQNATPT